MEWSFGKRSHQLNASVGNAGACAVDIKISVLSTHNKNFISFFENPHH